MIGEIMAGVVAVAVVAIFVTTGAGQRLVRRLGLRRLDRGAAPDEDRAFLLRACDDDPAQVAARLDALRARHPELDEARLYRRAIRAVMNERGHSSLDFESLVATPTPSREEES